MISISGVADGATYAVPVEITISVDRGSYQATLNGAPVPATLTVGDPGEYTLRVTARSGVATAEREVRFTIAPAAGGSALLIRLFDLGANPNGGGGDAILITDSSSTPTHALIDAGPAGPEGSDFGFVARRLASLGVDTLTLLLLTHAHADHYGGLQEVLATVPVRRFVYNGQVRTTPGYQNTLAAAAVRADSVIVVAALREVPLGSTSGAAVLRLLPPLPDYLGGHTDDSRELNDGSVGAELSREGFRMFFTGDGEIDANERWRTMFTAHSADVDVLKVGHHGANDAVFDNGFNGTSTWLQHTDPEVAVISANGTTHPRIRALSQLLSGSALRTYCTNVHGEITIRVTAAGAYTVDVQRNADANCVPGQDATT